jgi:magnesium chelatase family protein
MRLAEALKTTRIPRIAGLTGARTALVTTRPCRAPRHPLSDAGLVGGGHVPMPGEVSLAPHGVRCLDELPEFRRQVIEALRQTLDDGVATIVRMQMGLGQVVAATTPLCYARGCAWASCDKPECKIVPIPLWRNCRPAC